MRQLILLGLLLGVWLVVAAPATGQVPGVEEIVSDVVGTAGSTVDGVVDTAEQTAGQATGAGGSASSGDVVGSTGILGSPGGTSPSGSTASSGGGSSASARPRSSDGARRAGSQPRIRSRFDRLPRRLETLLERIELGRHVRANLRRLEQALASASPELRRRVLRLIRAEIARLREGGVTRAERQRIQRLRFVVETLAAGDGAGSGARDASTPSAGAESPPGLVGSGSAAGAGPAGDTGPTPGKSAGVLGTQVGGGTGEGEGRRFPVLGLPGRPDDIPFGVGVALLALLALGLVGVVAGVTSRILGRVRSG